MTKENVVLGPVEQSKYYKVASRRWIARGSDVHVKEFTLEPGQEIPWHHHSNIFDVFYCIEGELIVEREDVETSEPLSPLVINVGDSGRVDVGTAHRPYNRGDKRCRFVIVQGTGPYDYIRYEK